MANVTFHVGSTAPPESGLTTGGLYINNDSGGIWYATSEDSRTEVGSWVKYAQTVTSTSGTKLGTITINGTPTNIYQDDSKGCSYNTSSKIFLIGAKTQSSTSGTGVQTYSHDTAYVGTDGCLYSNSSKCITVATETKNTAGGTSTNDKLFFVGMKTDNTDSAQTYTNSYCYALGTNLYSNGFKCGVVKSITVKTDIRVPSNVGDMKTVYYTLTDANFEGAFLGYSINGFNGIANDTDWAFVRQGVTIGATTSGGAPSYKIGAKVTRIADNFSSMLSDDSVVFTVFYSPYVI